jgi:cytochrome P450
MTECASLGDAFTIHVFGLPPIVVVRKPEDVKAVFADGGDTMLAGALNARTLRPFLGDHSILLMDQKVHHKRRQLLAPPYHGDRMRHYGPSMIDVADEAIERWPLGRPFKLLHAMHEITVRVILRSVFGRRDRAAEDRFAEAVMSWFDLAGWGPLLLPAMQVDLGPLSPWGRFRQKTRELDALLYDEITARRRGLAAGEPPGDDMLSGLIEGLDLNGQRLTDEEIRDELVTVFIAGHGTSATSLSWSVRWLAERADLWDELVAELARAADAAPLTPEAIAALPLLDATVREVLRLQPVFPFAGRLLGRPTKIGPWELPEGVAVFCSVFLAQRDPAVFEDPLRFDPRRFLGGRRYSPFEYFPWGGGTRRCLGVNFATYEIKMVLSRLLTRTRFELRNKGPIREVFAAAALVPSEGLPVAMTERRGRDRRPGRSRPQAVAHG